MKNFIENEPIIEQKEEPTNPKELFIKDNDEEIKEKPKGLFIEEDDD